MTPTAFIEMVAPHLPVGPYAECTVDGPCIVLSGPEHGDVSIYSDVAARLLLGAVVEEAAWMTILTIDGGTVARFDPYENTVAYRGTANGTDLFAKLEAALSARKAAAIAAERST